MKRSLSPIALVLAVTGLTACVSGQSLPARTKVNPSSGFLISVAKEVSEGKSGPMCEMVIDDWVAQNKPKGGNQ